VILAILFEAAAIFAYVELTRTVLYPYAPSRYNTMRVNLAGLAISHVVPGGTHPRRAQLSHLQRTRVPKETNAFGLAAQGAGSAVVLNLIFWCALVISIPLNGFNPAYGFARWRECSSPGVLRDDPATHARQRHADRWLRAAARHLPCSIPTRSLNSWAKSPDASHY